MIWSFSKIAHFVLRGNKRYACSQRGTSLGPFWVWGPSFFAVFIDHLSILLYISSEPGLQLSIRVDLHLPLNKKATELGTPAYQRGRLLRSCWARCHLQRLRLLRGASRGRYRFRWCSRRSLSAGSRNPKDFISPLLMPRLDVSEPMTRRCLIYLRARNLKD